MQNKKKTRVKFSTVETRKQGKIKHTKIADYNLYADYLIK